MGLTDDSPTTVVPAPSNYDLCGAYSGTVGAGAKVTIDCDPNIIGRYMVIQIPGSSETLTLCEVEAFGEESGNSFF